MDSFAVLSVGAKFDKTHNAAAKGLFQKKTRSAHAADARTNVTLISDPTAKEDMDRSIAAPPPCPSLDLFGRNGAADEKVSPNAARMTPTTASLAPDKPLKPMSAKRMHNLWRKYELQVTGTDVPPPIEHFSDLVRPPLNTPHNIVNNLFARHHRVPTPIQMQAIPSLIQHRDVLACAPTGSGKTIAFLVPLFALLQQPNRETGVRALIITPTMELAQQIEREAFFLIKGQRWRFVQHGQTTRNKDIFVSTPGRVAGLISQKLLDLSQVQYLVFDEGDRLWDDKTDFITVVDAILTACTRQDKVISLFTATLSERIETAARSVMGADPVRIIVRGRHTANLNVKQRLVFCGNELGKIVALRQLVRDGITPPVLIFVQSIERSKDLYEELRAQGLHMAVMNARMTTEEREEVVTGFRLGKIWVLVTTELLARGIDFKNVGTVINFDFPITVDAYIHRIGRTGRAGKTGLAVTFFTEVDRERLPGVARMMRDSGNAVEDWMLAIKVDRNTQRRLARTTPRRMILSTRKRMMVADRRLDREYRRLAEDKVAATATAHKRQRSETADESDDDE